MEATPEKKHGAKIKPGPKPGFKHNRIFTSKKRNLSLKKEALIVKMLSAGHPIQEIEDTLQTGQETIKAVSIIHADSIDIQRKKLAGKLYSIIPQVLSRIENQVQDRDFETSTKDLSITGGILIDKYERMIGSPTQVIQVTHVDPGREDYQRFLDAVQVDCESVIHPIPKDIPTNSLQQSQSHLVSNSTSSSSSSLNSTSSSSLSAAAADRARLGACAIKQTPHGGGGDPPLVPPPEPPEISRSEIHQNKGKTGD